MTLDQRIRLILDAKAAARAAMAEWRVAAEERRRVEAEIAMFARGGGGAKGGKKGKAGDKAKKAKGAVQAGGKGAVCCKGEGGKFAPGNNYGSLNRGSAKVAANAAGRRADAAARAANVRVEATKRGAGPAAAIAARSKLAASMAGRVKAARDKEAAVKAQKEARNAKARERRAAKKEASKVEAARQEAGKAGLKRAIDRMVRKSQDTTLAGETVKARRDLAKVKAAQAPPKAFGRGTPERAAKAAALRARRAEVARTKATLMKDASGRTPAFYERQARRKLAREESEAAVARPKRQQMKVTPKAFGRGTPERAAKAAALRAIRARDVAAKSAFPPIAGKQSERSKRDLAGVAPAGPTSAATRAKVARVMTLDRMVRASREAAQNKRMVVNQREKARRLQAEADKDVRLTAKRVAKAREKLEAARGDLKAREAAGVVGILQRQKDAASAKVAALKAERDAAIRASAMKRLASKSRAASDRAGAVAKGPVTAENIAAKGRAARKAQERAVRKSAADRPARPASDRGAVEAARSAMRAKSAAEVAARPATTPIQTVPHRVGSVPRRDVAGQVEATRARIDAAREAASTPPRPASAPIRPVAPPPKAVASRPISDPARMTVERAKLDEAFVKSPGSKDNFVTLADLHKTMPHLSRQEFVAVVDAGRRDGTFTLDTHEGLSGPPKAGAREAAIEEYGSKFVYISRR